MSSENEQVEVTDVVEVAQVEVVDYDIEITKGQYWVRHNQLVAFVVDVNQHAVIYQNLMSITNNDLGEETAVFDFDAGQELATIDRFRTILRERQATLIYPDPTAMKLALHHYQTKFINSDIAKPVLLPQTLEDAINLADKERYTLEKRIIPPPIRLRKRKALHWLKAGVSGTMVCRLWGPELDNWITPDGQIDVTARIGFVNGYHALAAYVGDDNSVETFEQLTTRIVDLLRKKNLMFDESKLKAELNNLQMLFKTSDSFDDGVIDNSLYPVYDLKISHFNSLETVLMSETPQPVTTYLGVYLFHQDVQVHHLLYSGILNKEFIPNQKPVLSTSSSLFRYLE